MKKLMPLIIFAVLLCLKVSGAPLTSPVVDETATIEDDIAGSVIVGDDIDAGDIEVEVLLPTGGIETFSVDEEGSFTIPEENLSVQGLYKYRFKDDDGFLFPENGWFSVYVNNEENEYLSDYSKLLYNDSQLCEPFQENFTCKLEHFQAYEINRFAKLYYETGDESYKENMFSLMEANWTDEEKGAYCEPRTNFNCTSVTKEFHTLSGSTYNGPKRQGTIIRELWDAYGYTEDEEVKDLARNFSEGSADECDVHDDDEFDCGNSRDQGFMIQGYATAYKHSLNKTYLEIAEELISKADTQDPHKELVRGFSLAEPFLEKNLTPEIENMTKSLLGSCSDCEDKKTVSHQLMFLEAYNNDFSEEVNVGHLNYTLDYMVEREIFDAFQSDELECGHTEANYTCASPKIQNRKARLYRDLTYNFETFSHGFYDLRIGNASVQDNVNLSIKYKGEITEPEVFIKDAFLEGEDFENESLNRNGTFEIPIEFFQGSTFIEIYLKDTEKGIKYPQYNYSMLPVPLEAPADIPGSEEVADEDPEYYCSPFADDPDYACRYEYMQGDYMGGLSTSLDRHFNSLVFNSLRQMTDEIIDPYLVYSTCDPLLDEYQCRAYTTDPVVATEPGVYRAASLSIGYLEAYKQNNDIRLLKDAELLLNQEWDECSLINENFDCGEENQGKLLEAVVLLYQTTGNKEYKKWIGELVNESIESGYKNTSHNVLGILKAYPYSKNSQLDGFIRDGIDETISECEEAGNCTPYVYYESLEAAFLAYKTFTDQEFFNTAQAILASSPTSDLYCDPAEEGGYYHCEYPDEQGRMISGFSSVENNFVITNETELNVTMRGETSGEFESLIDINCTVENIDNVTMQSEEALFLETDQEIVNGSVREEIESLEPEESRTINYTLNLTTGGERANICRILSFEDRLPLNVTNIGEILDVDYTRYVNEFTSRNFTLEMTNIHDFLLEDLQMDLNHSFNASSVNATELNDTIRRDYLEGGHSVKTEYEFNNLTDSIENITMNATSKFGGATNETLVFYIVNNSLPHAIDYNENPTMYDNESITLNLTNNKPFNISDLSVDTVTTSGTDIENSSRKLDLPSNESKPLNFSLRYNESGVQNISFDISAEEGINLSPTIKTNVSPRIIGLDGDDQEVEINESINFPVDVSNIGELKQTNIQVVFKESHNLDLMNFNLPSEYYYGEYDYNFTNSTLPFNFSQVQKNLTTTGKNVTMNWSDYYNFSITANDTYKNKHIPQTSDLNIKYNYNGSSPGDVSLMKNGTPEETECVIKETQNETSCQLDPGLDIAQLFFEFNTTENVSFELKLSSMDIENEYKYSYSYHDITDITLPSSVNEVRDNLTTLDNNITAEENFNLTTNDTLPKGHKFHDSVLNISYDFNGSTPGEVSLIKNETREDTGCEIIANKSYTTCDLDIEEGPFDVFFDFNSTKNLTLFFFEIENTIKNPKDRLHSKTDHEGGEVNITYLEINESVTIDTEVGLFGSSEELEIVAISEEEGRGVLVIDIFEEEDDDDTGPSGGRGGTADEDESPPPAPPSEPDHLSWHYEYLYTFEELFELDNELRDYFDKKNKSFVGYNKTLEQRECLNVTRFFNVTSNITELSITNNCDFAVENLYFYENVEERKINAPTTPIEANFSNGSLFKVANVTSFETFQLEYMLSNLSKEEVERRYNNFSIHIKEEVKEEEVEEEEEPERKVLYWDYDYLHTFEEPLRYDPALKDYLGLENITNISYEKTLNITPCLLITRSYDLDSNVTQLNITNACIEEVKELYLYENISGERISNFNEVNYSKISEGVVINISSIAINRTLTLEYTVSNLSAESAEKKYNHTFIHVMEPEEKVEEGFLDIELDESYFFALFLVILISVYVALIRYKVVKNPLVYMDPSPYIIKVNKKIQKLKKKRIIPKWVRVKIQRIKSKWEYLKLKYIGKYPIRIFATIRKSLSKLKSLKILPKLRKARLTSLERKLMDINLKLKYAEKMYKKKDYEESEKVLNEIPLLILTSMEEAGDKCNKKDKEKIHFLLKRASTIYTNIQVSRYNELSASTKKSSEKAEVESKKESQTSYKSKKASKSLTRLEKQLMDINIKLKTAENSFLKGDYSESEDILNEIPFLILSAMESGKGESDKETREKIDFLLKTASNIYNQLQQSKGEDSVTVSKSRKKDEEDSNVEVDLYTKLLKIKQLNERKELEKAQEEIEKVKKKIEDLDDYEKKKEKFMLLKKLKEHENMNRKLRESSILQRVKRFFKSSEKA